MTARQESRGTARRGRTRHRLLSIGFVLVAAGTVARLVQLQLSQEDLWRERAERQGTQRLSVAAARGGIYDRNGRPLAISNREYRGYLAPQELPPDIDARDAVERVGRLLALTPEERQRLLSSTRAWRLIPRRISSEMRATLASRLSRGLHFEPIAARAYPEGGLARSIIGSLNADGTGRSGIELELDSVLSGRPGSLLARRDANGDIVGSSDGPVTPPRPGRDVFLTLDADLQAVAEHALDRALERTGASGGDVLMLDPRTGDLLALASRRPGGVGRIPALSDPYEPGSTVKPFLLAALLAERAARLDEPVDVHHGELWIGDRRIRDVHPYDTLTVADVLRFSSNIGAAKLSRRLAPGVHYRYLRDFGFGMPTGLRLPGESAGRLPRPSEWSGYSQVSLAIGYELLVTSVQLASAYGALANDGVLLRPGIVREIRDPVAGSREWRRPVTRIRRLVNGSIARTVTRVLNSVVDEGGTGAAAALSSLRLAGKTGTARIASGSGYSARRYVASFVGYAPAEDPRLVILTKLEDPRGDVYGGGTAAPVSREILEAALASRGVRLVPGGGPDGTAGPARREAGEPTVWFAADGPPGARSRPDEVQSAPAAPVLPDVTGLTARKAVARLHALGLHVALECGERVRRQEPPAGTRVRSGAVVRLR
ncbi:MAG: penicillin-binding transpeptidase domain-containing protein [Gemmatimonadota bacterium]